MEPTSFCLYFPKDPEKLLGFLESVLSLGEEKDSVELLLWVDNDDHAVSSEFYAVRRLIRKELDLKVFVNPPVAGPMLVAKWLGAKATHPKVAFNPGLWSTIQDALASLSEPPPPPTP